jgi:uncharacterized membrane protein
VLFFTRWITHFCAPAFVFLAGLGAFLYGARWHTRAEVARFLVARGVYLIVLEFTLVHFGWFFSFEYHFLLAQAIWMLGWSMVALAALALSYLRYGEAACFSGRIGSSNRGCRTATDTACRLYT